LILGVISNFKQFLSLFYYHEVAESCTALATQNDKELGRWNFLTPFFLPESCLAFNQKHDFHQFCGDEKFGNLRRAGSSCRNSHITIGKTAYPDQYLPQNTDHSTLLIAKKLRWSTKLAKK